MQINVLVTLKYFFAAALAMLMSFFMPIWPFLVFTVALVVCDLYSGTQAAKYRGEVIHSKGFRRSVIKISLYFTAMLLTEGFNQVFLRPKGIQMDITWVTSGMIAMTEIKSNFENVSTVTGVDIWAKWAEKIPGFFQMKESVKDKAKDE